MGGMDRHIVIREYEPADKEAVLSLIRANTPEYFAPEEEADLSRYLDCEREWFYVLLFGGKIVGCGGINLADERTTGKISWDIRHPEDHGQNLATGFRILPEAGLRAQGGEKGLLGRGIRPVCHGVRRLEMTVANVRFLMFRLAVSLKLCLALFLCGRELAVALGPRYAAAVAGTFGNTTRRFVRRRPCEYIYERTFLSGPGPENERIEGFRFAARPRSFFSSTVASC